jgi:acetyltransferase-like isoleucine patch superfamily enzyme
MPSTTYSYDAGTDSYFVTGGCGDATITIPDTHDDGSNGPHPVTRINASAFLSCTSLVTLILGNNVTTIGASAFQYCTNLTSVTFPTSSLTTIGSSAFWGSGLTSVVIPNSVTSMSDSIFVDCINLASATLPINGTINNVPQGTFVNCTSLISITIPSNYTIIGTDAFTVSGLQTVVLNEGLLDIRTQAFYGCRSLRGALTIPNTVTIIRDRAFEKTGVVPSTSNEFNVIIGSGTTNLRTHCFYECYAKSFTFIPGNLRVIGPGVFFGCIYLTNLSIPNSVITINPYSIDPNGFTYTDAPFTGTTLKNLTIGDGLAISNHVTFSQIFVGANISNLILGKGITAVQNTSFNQSGSTFRTNLKSITFQAIMSSLGASTFGQVNGPFMLSLTEIFFNDFTTPFSFGAGMFDYLDYNVKVYIKPKQNLRIFKK